VIEERFNKRAREKRDEGSERERETERERENRGLVIKERYKQESDREGT
jgi:hypothetical protein